MTLQAFGGKWRPLSLGLLVLVTAACAGGEADSRKGSAQGRRGAGERMATTVAFAPVAKRDLATTLELSGTLQAEHQVDVTPRTAGRLVAVTVNLGDRVGKGQVLAQLDDADLRARLSQAEAALASQQATLRQRQIEQANLQRQADRDKSLLAQDFIARQDYENSRTRAESGQAMISLSRAEVARQQASLQEARQALANARLIAPMAGVVSARHLDAGAGVSPGTAIVSLVAPGGLRAIVQVTETALPKLQAGRSATVKVDAWPGDSFAASIQRIAPAVSPQTRTAQVELNVIDPQTRLRPGMFARVQLALDEHAGVPAVPRQAVVTRDGQTGVFIAEGGKARFLPVKVGMATETQLELTSGPAVGTPVITLGNHLLADGALVRAEGQRPQEGRRRGAQ